MLQTKSIILGIGTLALFGLAGLTSVQAQPQANPSMKQETPAVAVANPTSQQPTQQMAENTRASRGERMVCKSEAILGTRLKGQRVCRTADEWRRISRGFQARLKETNDRASGAFSGN